MGLLQRLAGKLKGGAKVALCLVAVLGGLGGLSTQAYAALPASITSVFDTANDNAVAIGWVVLGLIAAIMAFKFIRRAL